MPDYRKAERCVSMYGDDRCELEPFHRGRHRKTNKSYVVTWRELTRAEKDKKLGAVPLKDAECDKPSCNQKAITRWYEGVWPKQTIAATLCAKHNAAFEKEQAKSVESHRRSA